jgi:hypothetical protein
MKKSQEKALYSIPGWEEFVSEYKEANISEYRSFENAREYARNLNLDDYADWVKWRKSGDKPDDIPSNPNRTYKNSGWVSYGDWLGTGSIAPRNRKFRSFEDSRTYAHSLKLSGAEAWQKWRTSGNRPDNIPSAPWVVYKDFGWVGMGDWLGTGNLANRNRKFRSFEDARTYAHSLKLNGQRDWDNWSKSGNRPDNIPSTPAFVYKDSGWIGYGDFLGTGNIANQNRKFCSFEEARTYAHSLKLDTREAWKKWWRSNDRPNNIPARPDRTYKNFGWISWGDWLGK